MAEPSATFILERLVMRLQAVKYTKVASLTILLFDYLITLDSEIDLIWKSTWGFGSILFFLARYSALIDTPMTLYLSFSPHMSADRCRHVFIPKIWVTIFGLVSAEAILFLRTSALYGNNKKMVIFLVSLWSSILLTDIVICQLYLRSIRFGRSPIPSAVGCFQMAGSSILYVDYILLLLQETLIVGLTFYRGVKMGISNNRVVKTLYRDGLLYFVCLLFISLGNIMVWVAGPPELLELLTTFQRVMHSVLSTRVLLHARGAARCKEIVTVSELRFLTTAGSDRVLSGAISPVQGLSENDDRTAVQSPVDQ